MNRIYQGRINGIYTKSESDRNGWVPTQDGLGELWKHHEIFQQAVNYYYLALAAMGRSQEQGFLADLYRRAGESWLQVEGYHGTEPGMLETLREPLGLSEETSLKQACDKILGGNPASEEVLLKAAMAVIGDLGGDSSIQQKGRQYLPQLTKPGYAGTFFREKTRREKDLWQKILLPNWLHQPEPEKTPLLEKMAFHHFANPVKGSEPLPRERLVELLETAISFFYTADRISDAKKKELLEKTDQLPQNATLPAYAGASVKNVLKERFYAYLITKYLWPNRKGLELMRVTFPPPKKSLDNTDSTLEADECTVDGDDPVKAARGGRGYVFRAFTALPLWGGQKAKDIAWIEFDIAAFKEALTTLNQYREKTKERKERREATERDLAIMRGEVSHSRAKDGDETERTVPVLLGDPRHDLFLHLLGELKIVDPYAREFDRGVYEASLRHYRDLKIGWNKILRENKHLAPEDIQGGLIAYKNRMQAENPQTFGDTMLFEAMCRPKYHPIWQDPDAETAKRIQNNGWADDVVNVQRIRFRLERDLVRFKEPIRFRPAHSVHSMRHYRFSDIGGRHKAVHGGYNDQRWVEVSLSIKNQKGIWEPERRRLHVSAPRLARDKVIGENAGTWAQPMTQALHLPEPSKPDFSKCAVVQTMKLDETPKGVRLRAYLDFPLDIDPAPIQEHLGKKRVWQKQFNGEYPPGQPFPKKGGGLYWPGMEKAPKEGWWSDESVIQNGVQILGIDLGQRTAVNFALLEMRCDDKFTPLRNGGTRESMTTTGHDGTRTWKAAFLQGGTDRLPGEDCQQYHHGVLQRERYGKKGRKACGEDAHKARAILEDADLHWLHNLDRELEILESIDYAPQLWDRLLTIASWTRNRLGRCYFAATDLRDDIRRDKTIERLEKQPIPGLEFGADLREKPEHCAEACFREYVSVKASYTGMLTALANEILPLRGRRWEWGTDPETGATRLVQIPCEETKGRKIRGQRGLSFARLEQIEKMRRLFQALNRMGRWNTSTPVRPTVEENKAMMPEPCPDIREKILRMREQRVNQTAHLILARALGVRLKTPNRSKPDHIHGEYEVDPARKLVDIIVLEALSSYRMSQGRGPSENKRLATWAHRAISEKVRELAEPFGIPVVEAPAEHSSRFHAWSGRPGHRGFENSLKRLKKFQRANEEAESLAAKGKRALEELERLGLLKNHHTILLPVKSGSMFLPFSVPNEDPLSPVQADINAAINIALRAVAGPGAVDLHHVVRLESNKGKLRLRAENKLEKALAKNNGVRLEANRGGKDGASSSARIDREGVISALMGNEAVLGSLQVPGLGDFPLVTNKAYYQLISRKDLVSEQFARLNAARLRKWGLESTPFDAADPLDPNEDLIYM